MPIRQQPAWRDGHDPLRRTGEIETPYSSTPRRLSNTGRTSPRPEDEEAAMSDEDTTRFDYDTQSIIALEPKTQRRQTSRYPTSAGAANRQNTAARQQASAANRQSTEAHQQASVANRQNTAARQQASAANRQTTDAQQQASAANRQNTAARQQASAANRQTTGVRPQVTPASAANRQSTIGRQQVVSSANIANRQTTSPRQSSRELVVTSPSYRHPSGPRQDSSQLGTKVVPQPQQRKQFHWLVPTGMTMIITILCYLLLYGAWTGGHSLYNNLTYGTTTRTSHLEAFVGDHDSISAPTHFMAVNLRGTIDVIEFPGSDVTHAKVYPGPHLLWSNADKAIVTLEVKPGNNSRQPDIIVHIQGDTDLLFRQTTATFVLHNNGSGFSPMVAKP